MESTGSASGSPYPQVVARSRYAETLRSIAALVMALLAVAAVYCLFGLGSSGGLFEFIGDLTKQDTPLFPGSPDRLVTKFTGIEPVDEQLATLGCFFSPVVTGASKPLTMFSFWMLGQFGAGWTLMMLESLRKGNKWRSPSFAGTYGFFVQNFGFAVVTPIHLFLHLLTSPIAKPVLSSQASSVLLVSTLDLAILPVSVIVGCIVPSILMVLPAPSMVTYHTKQLLVAFWQLFPIWTVLVQFFIHHTMSLFCKAKSNTQKTVDSPSAAYLKSAAPVYTFVLTMCLLTHIPVALLALIPSSMLSFSPPLASLTTSSLQDVFLPPPPLLSWRMSSLADGVHIFLLWDVYISAAAAILWATVLYLKSSTGTEVVDSKASLPNWWKLSSKILGWNLLAGPFASVAVLLWERDAIVKMKVKNGI